MNLKCENSWGVALGFFFTLLVLLRFAKYKTKIGGVVGGGANASEKVEWMEDKQANKQNAGKYEKQKVK